MVDAGAHSGQGSSWPRQRSLPGSRYGARHNRRRNSAHESHCASRRLAIGGEGVAANRWSLGKNAFRSYPHARLRFASGNFANEYPGYGQELFDQLGTEAKDYLARKTKELTEKGLVKVSPALDLGYGAEEITTLARKTPDNFIAMCTYGRSGVKRWFWEA